MGQLTITEVAAATGMASSTLRFYERHGIVQPAGRAGGKRVYEADVVHRLALVDIYQQAGFSVSEIGQLLQAGSSEVWRAMAKAKLVELDAQIAAGQQARALLEHTLHCPNPTLGGCAKFEKAVEIHAADLPRQRARRA